MMKPVSEALYDSASFPQRAVALKVGKDADRESPYHQHEKGQLVMPTAGYVTSHIQEAIWMVPPQTAVWIPGNVPHSNRISAEGEGCMLFIQPSAITMPDDVCTVSISPMIREMILHLASLDQQYSPGSETDKLAEVLLDQLSKMPVARFDFAIPEESRLNQIAKALVANPGDRRTIGQWAADYAMSERTLSRLVDKHVGMTFGKWRGQLHIVVALQQLNSRVPVQRVAENLGYESVSAFITFFKKALGKSPKQYLAGR
ncbi:helix-turn-helix transcriptional regulator [Photobacterium galatheae]|uniref:AraC family transcriptional regulator n=1 Tax=Photobacterium galatheae TaxID=1654360 RepID=UPI00202CCFFB|nr:helix-turn-helix transcriptional regulator [Photobacterium galatheae]MCM0148597.1 helix-turn-helix transcriptional regulator [Photobacterium galatheae]